MRPPTSATIQTHRCARTRPRSDVPCPLATTRRIPPALPLQKPSPSRLSRICARSSVSCKNRRASCGGTRTARHSTSTFHQAPRTRTRTRTHTRTAHASAPAPTCTPATAPASTGQLKFIYDGDTKVVASFRKQLRNWCFKTDGNFCYHNPYFLRGKHRLLAQIKRLDTNKVLPLCFSCPYPDSPQIPPLLSPPPRTC